MPTDYAIASLHSVHLKSEGDYFELTWQDMVLRYDNETVTFSFGTARHVMLKLGESLEGQHGYSMIRESLIDPLFGLLNGRRLGSDMYKPLETLATTFGVDVPFTGDGLNYFHGFGGVRCNVAELEHGDLLVEFMIGLERESLRQSKKSLNPLAQNGTRRREALIAAKKILSGE